MITRIQEVLYISISEGFLFPWEEKRNTYDQLSLGQAPLGPAALCVSPGVVSICHRLYKQRFVPRFQTDSHTSVPFWCSSILSSLGETKNASLPLSFLSLAHASIVADQVFHYDDRRSNRLSMKNKLVHFATHLLLLSSRLFAAALVTASYNTGLWVFLIFAFHYTQILKCDLVSLHVLVSLHAKIVRANKDTTDRVQLNSYSNSVEIAAL